MNQLLFIETFVLGASAIAAIYHLMLFIQQRERYLLAYSIYLFSLATYIAFKISSGNYNPYVLSANVKFYFIEEFLQITMVCIYASFAAVTLKVNGKDRTVMSLWYFILVVGFISIVNHIFLGWGREEVQVSKLRYAISRFTIIFGSVAALIIVWQSRKSIFHRTIIIGSFVYAFAGFLSALSFVVDGKFFGLSGVEPYLIGCLIDIIIFSSAFGYRIKQVAIEKNQLLEAELQIQREMANMRTGIASNLHDDVGSTLSSISIYSEAVKGSILSDNKAKAIDILNQLGHEAIETISSMSDIVWAINPRNDNSDKLISRMKSYVSEVCRAMDIRLELDILEMSRMGDWSMAMRNNVYLIFKEAVNNSVKYANAQNLHVAFVWLKDAPVLIVSDDGCGFNPDAQDDADSSSRVQHFGGNGIESMKNRAKEIGAEIFIRSSQGKGTEVRLVLPVNITMQ